jgi:polyphosphate glucokinase
MRRFRIAGRPENSTCLPKSTKFTLGRWPEPEVRRGIQTLMRKLKRTRRVLMIDIGGGSVKVMLSGRREGRSFKTAKNLRPQAMVETVLQATRDWTFEVVSIGYPGLVKHGHPAAEPPRLGGKGWRLFDYERAFARPVRIINDAALQALAAYRGRRMLYVGLGTGFGSTLVLDDVMIPMELGLLHFDREISLLQHLADVGPQSVGYRRWRKDVIAEVGNLKAAFDVDEVVLGGGNAPRARPLPRYCRIQENPAALTGAVRLWGDAAGVIAEPRGNLWEIRRR